MCLSVFFLMIRRPPRSTRTDTLVPYTTLFRSVPGNVMESASAADALPTNFLPSTIEENWTRRQKMLRTTMRLNRLVNQATIWRNCRTRSEEHTSELQSLLRISYAVLCLKKKKSNTTIKQT